MSGDTQKGLGNTILTALTVVAAGVLIVVLLQRAGVIGGPPVAQTVTRTVASAVGATVGSTPTLKPNPRNLKAYLDDDDPAVKTTDIGPARWKIIDIHEHAQMISARPESPVHMIRVNASQRSFADYIVAVQCGMLLILWSVPKRFPLCRSSQPHAAAFRHDGPHSRQ